MNSYDLLTKPIFKNTYEVQSNQYQSDYIPYKTGQNLSNNINQERLSQSPPIILCESGSLRNSGTHRHRYLFYPSISRLSPYMDDNNLSNLNMVNSPNGKINSNFDLEQEVNRLRDENRLISQSYQNRNNNELNNERNNFGTTRGNNRSGSVSYMKTKGKYQDLLDKSNDLMNSISNLVREEEGKIRGPLGYYNNRGNSNREYDEFIKLKQNLLSYNNNGNDNNDNNRRSHYNTNYDNNGRGYYNSNNDNNGRNYYNSNYDNNMTDAKYKSGTLGDRNHLEIDTRYNNNFNKNNTYNDNMNVYSGNNNENENYNDNQNIFLKNNNNNSKHFYNNMNNNPKRNINEDNNNYIQNRDYIDNNMYSENNTNNLRNNNNINSGNINNMNSKGYNSNSEIYSKNINKVNNEENKNNNELEGLNNNNKNIILKNDGRGTMPISLGSNFTLNKNNDSLNLNNLANTDTNIHIRNQDNPNYDSNVIGKSANLNSKTNDIFNNNNTNNNNNNIDVLRNPKQKKENLKDFDNIENSDKTIPLVDNNNHNNYDNNGEDENKNNIKIVLVDENDKEILSEERKPFIGEEIKNKQIEGNRIIVITKDGEQLVLKPLKNFEGEILSDDKGNVILGAGSNYYYDKNGDLIISSDKTLTEGDKVIPVKLKEVKFNPNDTLFKTKFKISYIQDLDNNNPNSNNFKNDNFMGSNGDMNNQGRFGYYSVGIGGGGNSTGYRRKNLSKNKYKMFPKGDGDAKPPIIKKKRRKFKK